MVLVKVSNGGETRRITLDDTLSWEEFYSQICNLFTLSAIQLVYNDEEGDRITIGSDVELREAIKLARFLRPEEPVLRLSISSVDHLVSSTWDTLRELEEAEIQSICSSSRSDSDDSEVHELTEDHFDRLKGVTSMTPLLAANREESLEQQQQMPRQIVAVPSVHNLVDLTTVPSPSSLPVSDLVISLGNETLDGIQASHPDALVDQCNQFVQELRENAFMVAQPEPVLLLSQEVSAVQESQPLEQSNTEQHQLHSHDEDFSSCDSLPSRREMRTPPPQMTHNHVHRRQPECLIADVDLGQLTDILADKITARMQAQLPSPLAVSSPQIHNHILCDMCSGPVVGLRYKCTQCVDFDSCQQCFGRALESHDPYHLFLVIKNPLPLNTGKPLLGNLYARPTQSNDPMMNIIRQPLNLVNSMVNSMEEVRVRSREERIAQAEQRLAERQAKIKQEAAAEAARRQRIAEEAALHEKVQREAAERAAAAASSSTTSSSSAPRMIPMTSLAPSLPSSVLLAARFVRDVNYPDNAEVPPGLFSKSWMLKNSGSVTWTGVQLVNVGGMPGEAVDVPVVLPGHDIILTAHILAPEKAGPAMSYWRLVKDGTYFGHRVWANVVIVVPQTNTLNPCEINQQLEAVNFAEASQAVAHLSAPSVPVAPQVPPQVYPVFDFLAQEQPQQQMQQQMEQQQMQQQQMQPELPLVPERPERPEDRTMKALFDMGFFSRERNSALIRQFNNDLDEITNALLTENDAEWYSRRH